MTGAQAQDVGVSRPPGSTSCGFLRRRQPRYPDRHRKEEARPWPPCARAHRCRPAAYQSPSPRRPTVAWRTWPRWITAGGADGGGARAARAHPRRAGAGAVHLARCAAAAQRGGGGPQNHDHPPKGDARVMSTPETDKPLCFVICPIGKEGTEERERSDNVLNHIIRPAAARYHVVRADQDSRPGHITTQIVEHLLEAPLVVADLSFHNANVFYELAVRHGTRKPVIHMSDGKWLPPFDVAPQRTILFDATDLGNAMKAKEELARQIAAVELDPKNFDNPLSLSVDSLTLRRSDVTTDRLLAQLFRAVEGLTIVAERLAGQPYTLGGTHRAMGDGEPSPTLVAGVGTPGRAAPFVTDPTGRQPPGPGWIDPKR